MVQGMDLSAADIAYVRAEYVPLAELAAERGVDAHALIERRLLPAPSYVLPDGTEMVPADYFALADEAGGPEALPAEFARRCTAAGLEPSEEWEAYLTGVYGVCLRRVSPETIARKGALMDAISSLIEAPAADDREWRERLRAEVDALDDLERQFAPDYDRGDRFPVPPTRDRLIRDVRERFGLPQPGAVSPVAARE